jgi:hypothetical protein
LWNFWTLHLEILKERRYGDNTIVERPFIVAASTKIAATKHQTVSTDLPALSRHQQICDEPSGFRNRLLMFFVTWTTRFHLFVRMT